MQRNVAIDLPPRDELEFDPAVVGVAAWGALCLGAAVDLATTGLGLQAGLVEQNALGRIALSHSGLVGLVALKAVVAVFIAVASVLIWKVADYIWMFVPAGVGAAWAAAAVWNALLLTGAIA